MTTLSMAPPAALPGAAMTLISLGSLMIGAGPWNDQSGTPTKVADSSNRLSNGSSTKVFLSGRTGSSPDRVNDRARMNS